MKAIIYARVSSKEQEETGYSLDAQEKLLSEYAEKNNLQVEKTYRISESASGKQVRKTFYEIFQFATKNKVEMILCEKIDRLTRNLKDAAMVDDWVRGDPGRAVHFVKENFVLNQQTRAHDNLVWDMKVAIARFYTNNLSEEVKKGQKEKISQGWLPTKAPLGYKTVGEKGHKIHVLDEEKASLVRRMFELYATSEYSLKKLGQAIYEEGLRTRGGNKVVKSRIATLLSDPFYYGMNRWNNQITPGGQEPLISKELFDRVQSVLHQKTTPKYSKHSYLFKGSIRCIECKGTITWETHKGITYGHCNYWHKNCSQKTWAKEPEIENQLLPVFSNLQVKNPRLAEWIHKTLKESHRDEIDYHNSTVEGLQGQLARVQRRLDGLYDDKLDEKIDKVFYDRKFKEYTAEKEQVENTIQRHSQANTQYFQLGMSIYELSQKAPEIYQKAELEEKRQLIRLVFDNLALDEGKLVFSYSKPFEILAGAVQATNSSKVAILAQRRSEQLERASLNQNGPEKAKIDALLPG